MFFQAALQLFIAFNKFLQREDSILPVLLGQIKSFFTKLFGKFVTVAKIKEAFSVFRVDYDLGNQLSGKDIITPCCHTIIQHICTYR